MAMSHLGAFVPSKYFAFIYVRVYRTGCTLGVEEGFEEPFQWPKGKIVDGSWTPPPVN
jgi:hypothetical protein